MNGYINRISLSIITVTILGSITYAGKIITDAGDPASPVITENKQYGFGGWNYDNVNVRIVDIKNFSTALPGSDFNITTGIYTEMDYNMSFESDIWNITHTTLLAHLHGKDWPVGEPSGIKIINGDNAVSHGKPENCIMTTSYLESTYLDAVDPLPTICSSEFQTHKRFKINLLPSTLDGIIPGNWGKPVDIVFNLDVSDNNASIRRYQVLQKINNYTNKRLDGYKVEVLDENASIKPELTLSLGLGEGADKDNIPNGSDIWETEDMANMSHGLWGPIDKHFTTPGFFDTYRVYYPVVLNENNNTISYAGDMLGGNYQEIFGNWLPSLWAPEGIFWDDDDNPETDGILVAFWGVPPGETGNPTWYRGNSSNWVEATEEELEAWKSDPLYGQDTIEDVLNLGLNYIINVGENTKIGDTFILRITPHVDTNQTPPSNYVAPIPPAILMYLLN